VSQKNIVMPAQTGQICLEQISSRALARREAMKTTDGFQQSSFKTILKTWDSQTRKLV